MKKYLTYGLIVIIAISLLCACGENNEESNIPEETIESYSTEELQGALGVLRIRKELKDDVANLSSIKIRSFNKVLKLKDQESLVTLFDCDIVYENESGGSSVTSCIFDVVNLVDNIQFRDSFFVSWNSYEPSGKTINPDTVNKIVEKYSQGDIQSVLTRRRWEKEK